MIAPSLGTEVRWSAAAGLEVAGRGREDVDVPAQETFVTLRIRGEFDPSAVSRSLQLTPSGMWAAGDAIGPSGRTRTFSGWFLETRDAVRSIEIDEHLQWILERIEPRSHVIAELRRQNIDVDLDCFWSSIGMSGGPWIPPSAMARMGRLGLPLVISFYYSEPD